MEEKAFRLENVMRHYPGFTLGPLNLSLEYGSVMAYIGQNGAGKSTTMHAMMNLLQIDSGSIEVNGTNIANKDCGWKTDVGYVGDRHLFYENWNAGENLSYISSFYPGWSADKEKELCKRLKLPMDKRVKTLSTGNRVKLSLISALAYSPRLLILDEPTSGLDLLLKKELLNIFFEYISDTTAIFISTHSVSEVESLVDELVFLNEGSIAYQSDKDTAIHKSARISFTLKGSNGMEFSDAKILQHENDSFLLFSMNKENTLTQLEYLDASDIKVNRVSLEEISITILKEFDNVPVA